MTTIYLYIQLLLIYLPTNESFDFPGKIDGCDCIVDGNDSIFKYDHDIDGNEINSPLFLLSTTNRF